MWVRSLLCRNNCSLQFIFGDLSQDLLTCAYTSSVACMLCMYVEILFQVLCGYDTVTT